MDWNKGEINILKLIMKYIREFNVVEHKKKFEGSLVGIDHLHRNINIIQEGNELFVIKFTLPYSYKEISSVYCYCGKYMGNYERLKRYNIIGSHTIYKCCRKYSRREIRNIVKFAK